MNAVPPCMPVLPEPGRRRFLLVAASLAGGALVVGCADPQRQTPAGGGAMPTRDGQIALNGWIKVAPDGRVTVVMPKSEMGQGAHTGLLTLVVEELDCAWSQVAIENAPVDRLYGNVAGLAEGVPFRPDDDGMLARGARWTMTRVMREMGLMMTGGSSSIRDLWEPLREAAAVTRATLVEAVAREWSVAATQVAVDAGTFSAPGGRSMTFGDAVRRLGPTPQPAATWQFKPREAWRAIGRAAPRFDTPAKVDATAVFGVDVLRPGMLHAAVRMSPVRGGTVRSFDGAKAATQPGVKGVLAFPPAHGGSGGVAVVAETWWAASQALAAIDVTFDDGPMAGATTQALFAQLDAALDADGGFTFWKLGDADAVIASSARKVEARYRAPWLAHATLEPMNCTVEFRGDSATVWAPTQVPGFARRAAAKALDLDADRVDVQVTYLGGGFGRRLETDFVAQAATIAKAFKGTPVQVLWSREEDMRHDFWRPACVSRFVAALTDDGRVAAWRNTSAGQSIVPGYMSRNAGLPLAGPDKTTSEGAFDAAYAFPAARVAHVTVDLPVPVGFWRAVGHSHQAFFKESFADECAHAAGIDPLRWRLDLLAARPRQREVLELAASKAGWGSPIAASDDGAKRGRGIALHESFGAIVAQVAQVAVAADGALRIERVTCAIDCGTVVNPDIVVQQMEGAIVFGLSAALHGHVDFDGGRAVPGNFDAYPLVRIDAAPTVIDVHLVPSTAAPEGVGEPGVPPIAPAVANAIFAATGQRLRELPLRLDASPTA